MSPDLTGAERVRRYRQRLREGRLEQIRVAFLELGGRLPQGLLGELPDACQRELLGALQRVRGRRLREEVGRG